MLHRLNEAVQTKRPGLRLTCITLRRRGPPGFARVFPRRDIGRLLKNHSISISVMW
jgi:hypothetical protein